MTYFKLPSAGISLFACLVSLCLYQTVRAGAKPPPPPPEDLTKPHSWAPSSPKQANYYNLGPTGMMGIFKGPTSKTGQIFIAHVDTNSPAAGKVQPYDVLLGMNGKPFIKGDNLIFTIGNAINEAEKVENAGKITFTVWRDANALERSNRHNINVSTITVDDILKEVDSEDDAFSEWRTEDQQVDHKSADMKKAYEDFPIKATTLEVTLTLEVMGSYSDTSPWDCPKVAKIREQGWKVLEKKYDGSKRPAGRFSVAGMALLASGKPEHLEILKQGLHRDEKLMAGAEVGRRYSKRDPKGWYWHYGSWHAGYRTIFLAEYYLRTGDKSVLPGLRQWALGTARLQTGGGTWGHSASVTAQNFGKLGGPSPGYGAMNQAAGPCFYGLALAVKAGIDDPLVVNGLQKAVRFYSSYVDKGGVPYGVHPSVLYEDSNGKNGPPAFAMLMAGEPYKAKYYALCSAVGSTWGYRGGHGNGTFGNYWPQLAACVAGKEPVMHYQKLMQPWWTMLRRHDGSFVNVTSGSGGGIGSLFDPTAITMMHYSIPLAKTYTTGKDLGPETMATERDMMHLRDRTKGSNWPEFSTDEIISKLDTFSPEQRRSTNKGYLSELIKRFNAGEKDIPEKLMTLLDHKDPRAREAALYAIKSCNRDAMEKALPRAIEMLNDPVEIVRVAAVSLIGGHSVIPNQVLKKRETPKTDLSKVINPLFSTALADFDDTTADHMNTYNALQGLMINTRNDFAQAPFAQGYDAEKVELVLERFLTLDPRTPVMKTPSKVWDRDTVIRIAGPLVYTAENFPLNGIMFGGAAPSGAQSLLARHGFAEAFEASAAESNKITMQPRDIQVLLKPTKLGWFNPPMVMKHKGSCSSMLPWLRKVLVLHPNGSQGYVAGREKKSYPIYKAVKLIEGDKNPKPVTSLRKLAIEHFNREVDNLADREAKVAFCRKVLQPERKTYYRQIGAMTQLINILGAEAVKDLAPYLKHEHWRFYEHSQKLVRETKAEGVESELLKLVESDDDLVVAGALDALAKRGDRGGLKPALKLIKADNPVVRGSAARAIYGCSDGAALNDLLAAMKNAKEDKEFAGFENALLLRRSDAAHAAKVSEAVKEVIPSSPIIVRRSLFYVLGQIGGSDNLSYLKKRVNTEEPREFYDLVDALSWSPDNSATKVLEELITSHQGTPFAMIISDLSLKRVINGAEVLANVPDDVNLDFAEVHLKSVRNTSLITFLGNIKNTRCINLLYKYMILGPESVTATAVKSIIQSAEGIPLSAPFKERKQVSEVLADVLEYINVVHTRKDIEEVGFREAASYASWKIQADRAGVIMKRIYNPREEALDSDTGINEDDIDL